MPMDIKKAFARRGRYTSAKAGTSPKAWRPRDL
jgi:hypothetical protein